MPDYSKSKIYKLVCDNPELIYFGSTTQPLYKRLHQHKDNFKYKDSPSNKKMFEIGGVKIVLVEEISCENKEQLYRRERWYIENHKCLNLCVPWRSKDENKKLQADAVKKCKSRIITCECGAVMRHDNLRLHLKRKKHFRLLKQQEHT